MHSVAVRNMPNVHAHTHICQDGLFFCCSVCLEQSLSQCQVIQHPVIHHSISETPISWRGPTPVVVGGVRACVWVEGCTRMCSMWVMWGGACMCVCFLLMLLVCVSECISLLLFPPPPPPLFFSLLLLLCACGVCMHASVCAWVCVHACVCVHASVCVCVHVCVRVHTCMCACVWVRGWRKSFWLSTLLCLLLASAVSFLLL